MLYKNNLSKLIFIEFELRHVFGFLFEANNIECNIYSRIKSIDSIENKKNQKNLLDSQVHDKLGFRFVVNDNQACYKIFHLFLKEFNTINSKVRDYISFPKENNYQSIHLVIYYCDQYIELQIRTKEMDYTAEYGSAAHKLYKNEFR